jgi:hypothetical protein
MAVSLGFILAEAPHEFSFFNIFTGSRIEQGREGRFARPASLENERLSDNEPIKNYPTG